MIYIFVFVFVFYFIFLESLAELYIPMLDMFAFGSVRAFNWSIHDQ